MRVQHLLVTVALVALAGPARADESNSQASDLYDAGRELMARGRIGEACDKFDSSLALDAALDTRVALAVCREKNHQLATALGVVMRALDASASSKDPIDLAFRADLLAQEASLRPRLSKLTIAISPTDRIAGLEVLRDGIVVSPGEWNTALSIDGGTYKISARAPGRTEWSASVTIANERDAKTVEIPALAAAPKADVLITAPPSLERTARRSRVPGYVVATGALALGVAAIGLELSGRSRLDDARGEADNAKQGQLYDSANTRHFLAQGFGAASLACAGVAIWLFVRAPSTDETKVGLRFAPVAAPTFAGLVLSNRW
jgi:hypothetical protein